ncbi:MAG: flagella cluster protein [Haloferacaceae archaeon]
MSGSDGGFDPRARRHELKLLRESGDRALYENRGGVACPACDRPFERLLASERRAESFRPDDRVAFCVVRDGDRTLVFTHR